ncbi:MAG: T9SS type A sorting domain-containing protein [Crocinitomicaceae bacterium]
MKIVGNISTILIACLAFCNTALAQEQRVIGAAGTQTQGSSHSVVWTIGEVIIPTITNASNHLTQGFHQSDIYVLNVHEYSAIEISVYPNPARDIVNISSSENAEMTIYDIQGKKIQTLLVSPITESFNVSHLSRGTYTLVFTIDGSLAKQMKIIIL